MGVKEDLQERTKKAKEESCGNGNLPHIKCSEGFEIKIAQWSAVSYSRWIKVTGKVPRKEGAPMVLQHCGESMGRPAGGDGHGEPYPIAHNSIRIRMSLLLANALAIKGNMA